MFKILAFGDNVKQLAWFEFYRCIAYYSQASTSIFLLT